ncbi:unnamed protein product [Paramecium primaurelia]|uniref:Uncharacterized protein n=1 Tax=Paramecium primaurelia TaxID=5886 RepID=A0A8S1QC22_PARPR|nr:unnamed protein product [Paramecium primaurelia]
MSDEFPVPKPKQRMESNVLPEEEYLRRLEIIIKRDYYPELYKLDKMKNEDGNPDENMSLSQFLSNYTSDENVTLNEIIKKGDDQWYQKHAWMFQVEEQHKLKQAALQSDKLQHMIEGNRENNIQLNEYKALNPLFFRMDPKNERLQPAIQELKETDNSLNLQKVEIQNTRFSDHHIPLEFAMNQIDQKLQKRKLQECLNAQGVNVFYGSTPNLVGAQRFEDDDMLGLFSPAPQNMKTPLMTWGELGETPVQLDRSYMIPPSSQRDKVGSNLTQQLNVKKRNEQKQQEEWLKRRLSSITPYRVGSSISSRVSSELIKNFLDRRGSTNHFTPLGPKSKNIKKQQ